METFFFFFFFDIIIIYKIQSIKNDNVVNINIKLYSFPKTTIIRTTFFIVNITVYMKKTTIVSFIIV
jgi:hypothetical protein